MQAKIRWIAIDFKFWTSNNSPTFLNLRHQQPLLLFLWRKGIQLNRENSYIFTFKSLNKKGMYNYEPLVQFFQYKKELRDD
jgi:hypothetical protein